MLTLTATPVRDVEPAVHGEGPRWDAVRQELLWVDITRGLVLRATVAGDEVHQVAAHRGGGTVGFVVPAADGGWLLGADGGFTHLSTDGAASVLVEVPGEGPAAGTRMNDGAADPVGRLFGGTMAFDEAPGAGSLHRVDLDGSVHVVLRDLTISNGIEWSGDGGTVYLADSGAATVRAYAYDLTTGVLGDSRVVVDLTGSGGAPDGLTVDAEDALWVAVWGAGQVRRYSPAGDLLAVVEVPTPNTSSCDFAGPDLDLLVISTSTEGLSDPDEHAGRLFTVRPGVTGRAAAVYRGPLTGLRPV
ncbi:SMP-30/gluconolactonase/LRE family protein [Klenkia sp. PcliD-1-E]|uniref:SMP-30/gluconolactonase/LRE family protein n=1 Tax=Klenkia sp. PcliD-1-E TaxID=2954492 RepID=UPI002096BB5F|nr:SMP-30/gluconolactonase/LRE family protein [Klenkia sp. PcliD-1-E]MCO7219696.1 SMP-30/gluconolactonase/LRE family protein [Klenkia sp. PcliD-1-E]